VSGQIGLAPPRPGFTVRGLTFAYARPNPAAGRAMALRDVSCEIPAGSRTVLLGLNGSGKSTLLHLLSGLDRMRRAASRPGRIVDAPCWAPDRIDYARAPRRLKHALRSREFGFVGQQPFMLPHLTCAENITMPLALAGLPGRRRGQRLEQLLNQFDADQSGDLGGLSRMPAHRVSGGERQLMAVLRAIIHEPAVLFADEPFNHLDRRRLERMIELLCRWHMSAPDAGTGPGRPRSLVLVCHDLDIAAELATHAIVLRHGEIVSGRAFPTAELGHTRDQRREALRRLMEDEA
jgi:putative ABC transport system ATP-binding protein